MFGIVRRSSAPNVWQALSPRLLAATVCGLGFLLTIAVAIVDRRSTQRRDGVRAEEALLQASGNLERILDRRLGIAISLAALIDSYYDTDGLRSSNYRQRLEADFYNLTRALDRQFGSSLSVQLAPNGIITLLTDLKRNRAALGYDILADPRTNAATIESIRERRLLFVGPLAIVQGGEAVIVRQPIFIPGAFDRDAYLASGNATPTAPWLDEIPSDFWGFASVLLETEVLYRDAGLETLPDRYAFALRGRHGQGMDGDIFWGDPAVFETPLRTVSIALPTGEWIMGVQTLRSHWTRTLLVIVAGSGASAVLGYAAFADRKAKQSAHAMSQAKGEFLAMMSHELRTPMNGIIGLTDLAIQTDREDDRLHYLEKIQTSSQLLLRIVNDVLDFSKLDAGQLAVVNAPFSIDETLISVRDLLAIQAARKQIDLVLQTGADVPDLLVGDSLRLSQILLNLMSNAIKFTNAGSVTLEISAIETDDDRIALRFDVTDTGIGLTAEQIPALFDAFVQARHFDDREYGGTGLGLAICQRLADTMGGDISVRSQVGRGSCFSLDLSFDRVRAPHYTLPARELAANLPGSTERALPALMPISEVRAHWCDKRALVVDTSAASGRAIAAMLAGLGLDVTFTQSGDDAIEHLMIALEVQPFDLLLLDDALPDISIRETIAKLGIDFLLPPIVRVLVCPPDRPLPQSAQLDLDGFDTYLKKPVDRGQLRQLLQQAIGIPDERSTTQLDRLRSRITFPVADRHEDPRAPLAPPMPDFSAPPDSPASSGPEIDRPATATVLLVEDNDINQFVAREMLRNLNYVVEIARNGQMAIERVRQMRYDLILMDVQMPVMGGIEATQRIRQLATESPQMAWCADVAIVAMTAHSVGNYKEQCLQAGMNDWLTKPIDARLLQETIACWLSQSATVQPTTDRQTDAHRDPDRDPNRDPDRDPDRDPNRDRYDTTATDPPAADSDPLSVLPGIEVSIGLNRMGGDWEGYRELLELFAQTYGSFDRELDDAMQDARYDRAFELVHTLKGAAGNIGATDLAEASRVFNELLQAKPPLPERLDPAHQHLRRQLERILGSIDRALHDLSFREDAPYV